MPTLIRLTTSVLVCLVSLCPALAEDDGPLDPDGRLVQFERDIAPIFRDHCLECHGPEAQKGDFRIDDPDNVSDYLEAGDVESSSLYIDYIVAFNEEERMPPPAHEKPLSVAQLALVHTWIMEGANWPEGVEIASLQITPEDVQETLSDPESLPARFWAFQGFFHPATVHFPIALLFVGGLFVILSLKWKSLGRQVPLTCLLLGAASSVVGWSFATQRGYASLYDPEKEIFWHRWGGSFVTVVAVVLALIAIRAIRTHNPRLDNIWKIGLVALAAMSGMVGHQGGELHYGAEFYPKAFQKLLGSEDSSASLSIVDHVDEPPPEAVDETPEA
ncbi:c-type cytochrome domain-containing protein [Roseimaritima ulvae]|uniref:Planctomycete cytochrome C n=1 Tax=Roseimaritima ulvae TaxID=980254 RepID=A0A5B9QY23_9BACT|nr:c-type cytochrome domain-containing protein [Roseimaritima ulvae]QEG42912.1 Planctomycete cytochrome C [Roseimaritima ulvae]